MDLDTTYTTPSFETLEMSEAYAVGHSNQRPPTENGGTGDFGF